MLATSRFAIRHSARYVILPAQMADADPEIPIVGPTGSDPPRHVLPLSALPPGEVGSPLDYFRPTVNFGANRWYPVARFPTVAHWHRARAALARGHIESLMGEGEGVQPSDDSDIGGIVLSVREGEVGRALIILNAVKTKMDWCPLCGSTRLEKLRQPGWWTLWSVLFLGLAPFEPPRFACRDCGHRW